MIKKISKTGVIGAGTMGAALAQKFAQEGFEVMLADTDPESLTRGMQKIRQSFFEAVEKKVMSPAKAEDSLNRIRLAVSLEDFTDTELIVEAVFEDFEVKKKLFSALGKIVSPSCILATNTSSFSVTELSRFVPAPGRFIGLHFFYHAAKNRLVEIVPGEKTSEETLNNIRLFCFMAGKDPIQCQDAYGFAVNRFFVPWLNEAVRIWEEGRASKEEIDAVCMKVFGIGMGPFQLMNVTGVSIACHAEKTLEIFGKAYHVAKALREQADRGKPWDMEKLPDSVPEARTQHISDRMLGIVFYVCSQILDEGVCSATDLNLGARIGLKWRRGPVELMTGSGENTVIKLVVGIIDRYGGMLPERIGQKYWELAKVSLKRAGHISVITLGEPDSLNALSESTLNQLDAAFRSATGDPHTDTIVITGTGKAFMAGADIRFFLSNMRKDRICDIETFTSAGQALFKRIDESKKQVIALLNGLTFGGGLELALCADRIYAVPGALLAFPETGVGIYPGLGGTQRSVDRIGRGLSKYLVMTGKTLKAHEAETIGLIDGVISAEKMFDITVTGADAETKQKNGHAAKWDRISNLFEKNTLTEILDGTASREGLDEKSFSEIKDSISRKAPIAVHVADKLIDEHAGCDSELLFLRDIFSTKDAMLGLSSIGKQVTFSGE